jgi:hypothetical protein
VAQTIEQLPVKATLPWLLPWLSTGSGIAAKAIDRGPAVAAQEQLQHRKRDAEIYRLARC